MAKGRASKLPSTSNILPDHDLHRVTAVAAEFARFSIFRERVRRRLFKPHILTANAGRRSCCIGLENLFDKRHGTLGFLFVNARWAAPDKSKR